MDPSLEGGLWVLSEPAEQGPGVDAPPSAPAAPYAPTACARAEENGPANFTESQN